MPLAYEDNTFQDAHHPAIKARQRVPLSPANLLHQLRHLMAPQLRASSLDLVVEPIALRGQMRELLKRLQLLEREFAFSKFPVAWVAR